MKKQKMTRSKKNPFTAGIALMAVFLLASCTQDDALPGDNDGSMPALAVTTLQATDIDVSKAATRAVSTTDYPTANTIGFFVKADAANGYVACNNRKGEYNAARKLWLPTPDSIWLNSHDADIAVYAPYDAAHTTAATLNLAACLRPADGSKDIWCKHITANNKSKNLAVTLEHVYSRLALTVSRDANYKAEAILSALSLKGDEIYESATYKPFETTPYTYSTTTGLTPTVTSQTLNASTASATYDLLLIPTPLTGDITLTLTVDGKKMETTIEKTRFTGSKLDAGKQYNVDLTLKPGKLEIASVSLVKWDALPEINGGQAEFDKEIDGIDIGLSFVIAPGNLRAVKPAGSNTYKYFFADEQGYYSGVLGANYDPAGGDYFCWNTLSPDDIVRLDFLKIPWDDTKDPCRQVGEGEWYTPTYEQCRAITKKDHIWGAYTMKDGSPKDGMYVGTPIAPSEVGQDKYLFLPAAGFREKTGVITNEVNYYPANPLLGFYWGSTSSGESATNPFGLQFKADYLAWGTGIYTYSDTGMPVRCIKDKPLPEHAIEVEGLDFYVADANLRAIAKPGGGGYDYQFADEPGYYSGVYNAAYTPAGGDYFAWNTLDPAALTSSNTTKVWNEANDPCREVKGGEWYTPTKDQLQAIINQGWTQDSPYHMSNGNTVSGNYFGTRREVTEADQNNYLFLPVAGRRSSGSFERQKEEGFYWSTTIDDTTGEPISCNVNHPGGMCYNNNYDRSYGFSVRCVRAK